MIVLVFEYIHVVYEQLMIVAWMLILGGEFDMIVNLDGANEITSPHWLNTEQGLFPFFPAWWNVLAETTTVQTMLAGQISILRDKQKVLQGWESRWHWSATVGLATRIGLESITSQIRALHPELSEASGAYSLARHGPKGVYQNEEEMQKAAVEVWHRSSVLLANMAGQAGAEYYHFLQPNQYIPGSKPLTTKELAIAYNPGSRAERLWRKTYSLLLQYGKELRKRNINFFDLTQIFSNNHETLYRDACCHFNQRGYELIADAMLRHILETTNIPGLAPSGDQLLSP